VNTRLPLRPGFEPASSVRRGSGVMVEVLVCGTSDGGDDGAAIAASRLIRAQLPTDVSLRIVGQLDIDDLLSVRKGAAIVIVDAATGIDPGTIVDLPLAGLVGPATAIQPRSSHALAIPEVVGLADMIRGRPLRGRIVVIGGSQFGLGRPLSRPVAAALPSLSRAIVRAISRVRGERDPNPMVP
jgi:hydrogenase maturation protease